MNISSSNVSNENKSLLKENKSEHSNTLEVLPTGFDRYLKQDVSKDLELRLEKLDEEFSKYRLKCEIENKMKEDEINMLKAKNKSLSSDYKQLTEAYMRLEKQYHQRAKRDLQVKALEDRYQTVSEVKKTRNALKQEAIDSLTLFFGYL